MARKDLDEWIIEMGVVMHHLSSEIAPAAPRLARQKEWEPRVDVLETPEHILVKVELAGVRGGQFAIQYRSETNSILLSGHRQDDFSRLQAPTSPHQLEIDYGRFARDIKLPDVRVLVDESSAQLLNGILTIVLPKASSHNAEGVIVERTITVRRLR